MRIEPIKIEAENKDIHVRLAYLVDRHDFLEDILAMRERWGFKEIATYSSVSEILNAPDSRMSKSEKNKLKNQIYAAEKKLEPKLLKVSDLNRAQEYGEVMRILRESEKVRRMTPHVGMKEEAEDIAYKYNQYNSVFAIVLFAMACGVVKEKDYFTYESRVDLPHIGFDLSTFIRLQKPEIIFSISPHTTKKDFEQIYTQEIKQLRKIYKQFVKTSPQEKIKLEHDIEDIRSWYWESYRQSLKMKWGMYVRAHEKYRKKISYDAFRQAVDRYNKALSMRTRKPFQPIFLFDVK